VSAELLSRAVCGLPVSSVRDCVRFSEWRALLGPSLPLARSLSEALSRAGSREDEMVRVLCRSPLRPSRSRSLSLSAFLSLSLSLRSRDRPLVGLAPLTGLSSPMLAGTAREDERDLDIPAARRELPSTPDCGAWLSWRDDSRWASLVRSRPAPVVCMHRRADSRVRGSAQPESECMRGTSEPSGDAGGTRLRCIQQFVRHKHAHARVRVC